MKRMKKIGALLLVMALIFSELPAGFVKAASKKAVTVTTKKELNKALKDGKVKKITINIKGNVTIPKGNYGKKQVVINNGKGKVKNNGKFKSIVIADAKSYKEAAKGNEISIKGKKIDVTILSKGNVENIKVNKENADITLKVNGTLETLDIDKKAAVIVKGKTDSTIAVNNNAAGTEVTVSAPVNLTNNKEASINLEAGSDGSRVAAKADISVKVSEDASIEEIVLEKEGIKADIAADGELAKVQVSEKADVTIAGTNNDSKVAVEVGENAKGTVLETSTAVEVDTKADTTVNLSAGAEGSSIKAGIEGVSTSINNDTKDKVAVTTPSGSKDVDAGKTETVVNPSSGNTGTKPEPTAAPGGNTGGNGNGSGTGTGSGNNNQDSQPENPEQTTPVAATSISISGPGYVNAGGTAQLTAVIKPENATNKKVTWSASGDVTVDANGVVTGNANASDNASGTITAVTNDGSNLSYTFKITVVNLTSVTLTCSGGKIKAGTTGGYTLSLSNSNYVPETIKMEVVKKSGGEAVTTIKAENGLISVDKSAEAGQYTLKATVDGKEAAADFEVEASANDETLVKGEPVYNDKNNRIHFFMTYKEFFFDTTKAPSITLDGTKVKYGEPSEPSEAGNPYAMTMSYDENDNWEGGFCIDVIFENLSAGKHTIILTKDGYDTYTYTFTKN